MNEHIDSGLPQCFYPIIAHLCLAFLPPPLLLVGLPLHSSFLSSLPSPLCFLPFPLSNRIPHPTPSAVNIPFIACSLLACSLLALYTSSLLACSLLARFARDFQDDMRITGNPKAWHRSNAPLRSTHRRRPLAWNRLEPGGSPEIPRSAQCPRITSTYIHGISSFTSLL